MLSREQVLIARLHIEKLIADADWEEAAEVGSAVMDTQSTHSANRERLLLACHLVSLGMLGEVNPTLLGHLLTFQGLERADLTRGVSALKLLAGDDIETFLAALAASCSAQPSVARRLALLTAAVGVLDLHVASLFLEAPFVEAALRAAFGNPNALLRGHAVALVGALLRAAPMTLCTRLCPILVTAVLIEVPPLQAQALAIVSDVAFVLGRVQTSEPLADCATEQLSVCLRLLATCLYAPEVDLQHIAGLGLSKLALDAVGTLEKLVTLKPNSKPPTAHARKKASTIDLGETSSDEGEDCAGDTIEKDGPAVGILKNRRGAALVGQSDTILESSFDPESLLADLAFRYTAQSTDEAAVPKTEQATRKALMTSLLACFEALVAGGRTAELSNTVVWLLLGLAEEGTLDVLRREARHHQPDIAHRDDILDMQRLRCLRFLASLVVDKVGAADSDHGQAARNLCEAAHVNLQLEHGLNVDMQLIAGWLGIDGSFQERREDMRREDM